MPRPTDDLHLTDPELAANVTSTTRQLEQLFAYLETLNLQPHEHDQVVGEVTKRLDKKDHRLAPLIEEKWHEHPGWGRPDKPPKDH